MDKGKLLEYTVYLIQLRNSEGHWVDYSRDLTTDMGLLERVRTLTTNSYANNPYMNQYRVIKRTIIEEVIDA